MNRTGTGWDNAPTERGGKPFQNRAGPGLRDAIRAARTAASFEYIAGGATTGRDGTRRWATSHRCRFRMNGVWLNRRKTWYHDTRPMEDEKQREAQFYIKTE